MTTITLEYNSRNAQAQKMLEQMLSMGFFKTKTTARHSHLDEFSPVGDTVTTHFASETILAQDWLTKNEDEVWVNL